MDESRFDDLSRRMALAANRRGFLKGVLGVAGGLALPGAWKAVAANDTITVCHFTGSASNPATVLTISTQALEEHLSHGDYVYTDCCSNADCAHFDGECTQGICDAGACIAIPANEEGACYEGVCQAGDCVCRATTNCASEGIACGSFTDDCGIAWECGTCANPENAAGYCDAGSCGFVCNEGYELNTAGDGCVPDCTPLTCDTHPDQCGEDLDDGCGGTIDCGVPVNGDCAIRCGNPTICVASCGGGGGERCLAVGDGNGLVCRRPVEESGSCPETPCLDGSFCYQNVCYELC